MACVLARVGIYFPVTSRPEARQAGVNVPEIAQEARRSELAASRTAAWVDRIKRLPATGVDHERAMAALHEGREEFGARGGG